MSPTIALAAIGWSSTTLVATRPRRAPRRPRARRRARRRRRRSCSSSSSNGQGRVRTTRPLRPLRRAAPRRSPRRSLCPAHKQDSAVPAAAVARARAQVRSGDRADARCGPGGTTQAHAARGWPRAGLGAARQGGRGTPLPSEQRRAAAPCAQRARVASQDRAGRAGRGSLRAAAAGAAAALRFRWRALHVGRADADADARDRAHDHADDERAVARRRQSVLAQAAQGDVRVRRTVC